MCRRIAPETVNFQELGGNGATMHSLEMRLRENWQPVDWQDVTVLIGVSGGPDSVALFRAMLATRTEGEGRVIALIEPRSNTMRMGIHADSLPASLQVADTILVYSPESLDWDAEYAFAPLGDKAVVHARTEAIVQQLAETAHSGDQVLVMSNGGFENIHQRIMDALATGG